ncbi:MAG: acyl-CoA dehydrogenase [Pseudomonadota bacterium]
MYNPSENDLRFAIHEVLESAIKDELSETFDLSHDLVDAILSEAAKFNSEIVAPLNHSGDQEGCTWNPQNTVATPKGWKEAHKALSEQGWCGLETKEEYGGQNMSRILGASFGEMHHSANMAFSLCHLLTQGQIHALQLFGSEKQKQTYVPKLSSGEWTGTMNLTEPHAGTDLGALKTTAKKEGDHYRIKGQKIYITYGEHDMAENIIHLVLARTPDAPEGVKGISLFIVPKIMVNDDGSLGSRNDVKCVSIEHKMGINGSPTAVLAYGEDEGAIGYLVGEENKGLNYMFAMMNNARFGVGVQGLAISNRAYFQALDYAQTRVQGTPLDRKDGDTIIHHPDVQRLLATMRAEIEAMRNLMIYGAAMEDLAHIRGDDATQTRMEFLVPIMKAWCTERSLQITSDGVQVHGGMGFIEETGAAQHYRDARILPIYEGTTAIQANDIMFRKTVRDGGKVADALLDEIEAAAKATTLEIGTALQEAVVTARMALHHITSGDLSTREQAGVSVPYLLMMGAVTCGWMMLRVADAATNADTDAWRAEFLTQKVKLAEIYCANTLGKTEEYAHIIMNSARAVESVTPELLSA